jgi:hypothetical protein
MWPPTIGARQKVPDVLLADEHELEPVARLLALEQLAQIGHDAR